MEKNGKRIRFERKKVDVKVTVTKPVERNWLPFVKLKRLSKSEISKYTQHNEIIEMDGLQRTKKRKLDALIKKTKKQKSSEQMGLPITEVVTSNINTKNENIVSVLEFARGEIVWGKLRGWPHWPAKIKRIEQKKYEVVWFNDYRKSKLFRSQIYKFCKNFDEFSKKFGKTIGLETAAKEALLSMGNPENDIN